MKIKEVSKLIIWLYLFILSIELIKKTSLLLAKNLTEFSNIANTPIKALSSGWFATSIVQSSGTVNAIVATFTALGIISLSLAVYIILGSSIGSTFINVLISLFTKARKRRDFRHGFEIGLANGIYNILYIIPLFLIEFFFKIFNKLGIFIGNNIRNADILKPIPNALELITKYFVDILLKSQSKIIVLIFGFIILFIALNKLAKTILIIFGGEKNAKKFINRYFKNKYKSFLIGLLLTMLVFSAGVTISLLVPLAVSRIINLKKAIPFINGANIGTGTDIILASLVIGKSLALAVALLYILFRVIGALIWLPNTDLLFKISKYISKHILHVSRLRAFIYVAIFVLLPLIILLI